MATANVNGVRLRYEVTGREGVPLVLVHGSWGSHHGWDLVVPGLAGSFQVVIPHVTHPGAYVETVTAFIRKHA
jgi:pimeloyl-ACP methyl ester carboxylesterase